MVVESVLTNSKTHALDSALKGPQLVTKVSSDIKGLYSEEIPTHSIHQHTFLWSYEQPVICTCTNRLYVINRIVTHCLVHMNHSSGTIEQYYIFFLL